MTVEIKDNHGALTVDSISYNNGTGATDNTKAVFTNRYDSVFDTGTAVTIPGRKTLVFANGYDAPEDEPEEPEDKGEKPDDKGGKKADTKKSATLFKSVTLRFTVHG